MVKHMAYSLILGHLERLSRISSTMPMNGPTVSVIGVFLLGLVCAALRSDRNAYRFAGMALAIVLMVPP